VLISRSVLIDSGRHVPDQPRAVHDRHPSTM
jgi:hypothetical protein